MQRSQPIEHMHQDMDAQLLGLFRRGQAEGALRLELPALWLVRAYAGMFYGLAVGMQHGDVAPRDSARLMLATFLRGAAIPTAGARPAYTLNEVQL